LLTWISAAADRAGCRPLRGLLAPHPRTAV